MTPKQICSFKTDRGEELIKLHGLLQQRFYAQTAALEPLRLAAINLKKEAQIKSESSIWGYKISNLILPLGVNRHVKPVGLNTLRVRIDCNFTADISHWGNLEDPFLSYNFAFIIFGENNGVQYSICWHLDKDDDKNSKEYHPLYHMQYSDGLTHLGRNEQKFDWGQAIYLDSPRIVHYPMDIVLGIGFYLTNFHPKGLFETFINTPVFRRLYAQSKDNILKPFYFNLASHWKDFTPCDWNDSSILCPHLC